MAATESEQEIFKLAAARAQGWAGFPDPPPYSMLMLYGLEEEADALRGKQGVLESSLVGWQGDSATLQAEISHAQVAARVASGDVVKYDASPDDSARTAWQQDFAQLRIRAAERNVWFKIQTGLANAKLAVVRAELALLDKQIESARPHAVLSEEDLDKVHDGIKATTVNLEQDQQKAASENTRWAKEREAVNRNLVAAQAALHKGTVTGDTLQTATLEAQLRAADAWVAAPARKWKPWVT